MKTVSVRELQRKIRESVEAAQKDRVVVKTIPIRKMQRRLTASGRKK